MVKRLQLNFRVIFLTSVVAVCSTNSLARDNENREMGFIEDVTLDGVTVHGGPYNGAKRYKYPEILAAKEAFRERQKATAQLSEEKEVLNVIGNFKNGDTAIISRTFVGDFKASFGEQARLLFRVQPCRNVDFRLTVETGNVITCLDKPLQPAINIEKTVMLAGGQSVVADFPLGIKWRFEVFDRKLP